MPPSRHAPSSKRPRWEVESHRGPLPNNSTLGGQVGWRLITGRELPSCGGAEFQVQAGLHDIDVGSDRFSRSVHAGCRLGSLSASPKLIPEEWQPPGFDIV